MYTGILVPSNLQLCRLAVYFQMSFFWGLMGRFYKVWSDGLLGIWNISALAKTGWIYLFLVGNCSKTNSFHERTDQGTEILKKTSEMKLKSGVCKKKIQHLWQKAGSKHSCHTCWISFRFINAIFYLAQNLESCAKFPIK